MLNYVISNVSGKCLFCLHNANSDNNRIFVDVSIQYLPVIILPERPLNFKTHQGRDSA